MNHNNSLEFDVHEALSVFSFCRSPSKKHQSNAKDITNPVSNSPTGTQVNSLGAQHHNPKVEKDEIRSMMDFFIGATDFDTADSARLSKVKTLGSDSTFEAEDQPHFSIGVDLFELEKTRRILTAKSHKIQKRMSLMRKMQHKAHNNLSNLFLGSRASVRVQNSL